MTVARSLLARIAAALALLVSLQANPVQALSCMMPDLERTYDNAVASEATYLVFLGKIEVSGLSKFATKIRGGAATGAFSGMMWTGAAFDHPVEGEVDVTVNCISDWCGSWPSSDERIYFLMQSPETKRYTFSSGACGSDAFAPTKEQDLIDHAVAIARSEAEGED